MFGNKLKKLREENNLLQKDLAKILGVSAGAIGMYENNKRTPDVELIKKIASYFDVTIDYLLGGTSEKNDINQTYYYSNDEKSDVDIVAEEIVQYFYNKGEITQEEKSTGKLSPEKRKELYKTFKIALDMYKKIYDED